MSAVPPNKTFEEWTFEDLLVWSSWKVVEGMLAGQSIRSTMWDVLTAATKWKPPVPPPTKRPRSRSLLSADR
jgi:hypothetical protein